MATSNGAPEWLALVVVVRNESPGETPAYVHPRGTGVWSQTAAVLRGEHPGTGADGRRSGVSGTPLSPSDAVWPHGLCDPTRSGSCPTRRPRQTHPDPSADPVLIAGLLAGPLVPSCSPSKRGNNIYISGSPANHARSCSQRRPVPGGLETRRPAVREHARELGVLAPRAGGAPLPRNPVLPRTLTWTSSRRPAGVAGSRSARSSPALAHGRV